MTITAALELPGHGLITQEEFASLDATLFAFTLDTQVESGAGLALAEELPAHELEASSGIGIEQTLPAHELDAALVVGTGISFAQEILAHQLEVAAILAWSASLDAELPAHQLDATALGSSLATADLVLRAHELEAVMTRGSAASLEQTLPAHMLDATITGAFDFELEQLLPAHTLRAAAFGAPANVWRTWVVNTRKGALTEYEGLQVNSYAVFNDTVLAATPTGIRRLADSNSDAGAPIAARVETGDHDFETSLVKRVPRVYVGFSSDGDLEVHTIISQDGRRKYLLPFNGNKGVQQRRVPVGGGPKSTYWRFGLANRDGADFKVDTLLVYPELLRRRVI